MTETRDSLGDRMKTYEVVTRVDLPRRTHTIIRVDGKAFHSYTRHLDKPFDEGFGDSMQATALALAQQVTGTVLAYTQSDEISLVVADYAGSHTEPWMGGVLAKVVSLSAAIATAEFNATRPFLASKALFDSRAFTIDDPREVVNYLIWRQADARRNALAMVCDHHLGKRATFGKGTAWRQQALADAGVEFEAYPEVFRVGRLVSSKLVRGDVEYVDRRSGETRVARDVERRVWSVSAAPDFRTPALIESMLPVVPTG